MSRDMDKIRECLDEIDSLFENLESETEVEDDVVVAFSDFKRDYKHLIEYLKLTYSHDKQLKTELNILDIAFQTLDDLVPEY